MITALILAAAVHVLAPYEWTGWAEFKSPTHRTDNYFMTCQTSQDLGFTFPPSVAQQKYVDQCILWNIGHDPDILEEGIDGHQWCGQYVSKQEFDQRITKWRDQGFPHGICEGKPIS